MAVYTKGYETKRKFVTLAYEKLLEKNVSEVTVRELASEKGYSAPAIYKHFESLEYLIVIASVKFLDEYMCEYGKLLDSDQDLRKIYIDGWRLFNKYTFARPDIYYRLFWGQYNMNYTDAVQEYYELFPFSGSKKYPAYYYLTQYNNDIYQRDFLVLRRIANQGLMSEDDAEFLSRSNPLIVKGMLLESMDQKPEERKKLEKECNLLIEKNFARINIKQA
ncbi:MAG: TetR/AcrR family transcriptional regulator [Lachnospiraceae bacterium]